MQTLFSKALSRVLLAFILSFGLFAGGTSQAPVSTPSSVESSGYPLELQDDLGTTLVIPSKPESIISLSLFSDEVLMSILEPHIFAAVSTLSQSETYSNVAQKAQEIEPVIEFSVETVVGLYPDLVIAANWSEADKIAQVRQAGIPVFQIDTPFTLEGIREGITTLGELTGEATGAQELISEMDVRITQLEAIIQTIPPSERVRALDYNSWGSANGQDTTWDLILSMAGIINAAGELEAGDYGQVPLSKEVLVTLDPDILFLPSYIWGEDNGAAAFYDQVLGDPALQGMKAIQQRRAIIFPDNLKGTYSHFIVDAAETAARSAYPEYF